jgi:hypothetical protein
MKCRNFCAWRGGAWLDAVPHVLPLLFVSLMAGWLQVMFASYLYISIHVLHMHRRIQVLHM